MQVDTRVESAPEGCNQRLKLNYDTLLLTFAFKFNGRPYITAALTVASAARGEPRALAPGSFRALLGGDVQEDATDADAAPQCICKVGRGSLTLL